MQSHQKDDVVLPRREKGIKAGKLFRINCTNFPIFRDLRTNFCAIFSLLPSHKTHILVINHVVVPPSSIQRHWVISLAVNKEK